MKKKDLQTFIEFFALIGAWCFIVGLACPWMYLGAMVFGGAAAVTKLFHNVAED